MLCYTNIKALTLHYLIADCVSITVLLLLITIFWQMGVATPMDC